MASIFYPNRMSKTVRKVQRAIANDFMEVMSEHRIRFEPKHNRA
jgi:hypothetical protein